VIGEGSCAPLRRGGPLEGVRVVDFSSVIAGPWASHILADQGADVIKIESAQGDIIRQAPPVRNAAMGPVFLTANRSKRSVVLDLKTADGCAAALRLCANADVVLNNVRPAAMRRLGLDYAAISQLKPDVVYVSLVGFDQAGPYAARPTYDDLIQGASGLASLFTQTGSAEPQYVPFQLVDRISGISAVNAILAALFQRERTGRGEAIEVPMFETMAELVLADHLGGEAFVPPIGPTGYQRLLTPHRRPYRTSDGYVCVLLVTETHWARFFALAGRAAEYAADPRLCEAPVRRLDYDNAYRAVAEVLATRPSAEWLALLEAADIPVMHLHDIASLLDDPHLAATGFLGTEEYPSEGTIRTMRPPQHWAATPPATHTPAPRLGEHTEDVLREAGLDDTTIAAILERNAQSRG
jgi:crotonobetainyl-CoA:carnitine CoA-transferase CaiB-like acyl-CoA transferase